MSDALFAKCETVHCVDFGVYGELYLYEVGGLVYAVSIHLLPHGLLSAVLTVIDTSFSKPASFQSSS